jgi:hypothetical protein
MGVEDVFKGGIIVAGLAVGVGVAVLAPGRETPPATASKALIKAGLEVYDQCKVAAAELGGRTTDVVAEARAEILEDMRQNSKEAGSEKKNGQGAKA